MALSEKLLKRKALARRVLETPDGAAFYEELKREFFYGPATLAGKTAENMAFNLGRLDVLAYIEQLAKNEEE